MPRSSSCFLVAISTPSHYTNRLLFHAQWLRETCQEMTGIIVDTFPLVAVAGFLIWQDSKHNISRHFEMDAEWHHNRYRSPTAMVCMSIAIPFPTLGLELARARHSHLLHRHRSPIQGDS